ncbi:MAG: GMC oxidoreductase [Candidatus Gottesmanbacteria bacterium]|nr:GMC oxidoreductase [Candidatus Gottesmanbacteria bacterium]
MTIQVAVIGSGLSAIGAIKALQKLGYKPTVLDCGETLDLERSNLAEALSAKDPGEWTDHERKALSQNFTVDKGDSIPKKLLFGSDYFYGKSRSDALVEGNGNLPPFSYALGGFSVGWGAASLPPQECDLNDWPINADEINKYCGIAISDLPYSARADGLSLNFKILQDNPQALHLNEAEEIILDRLNRASILEKDKLVFGQSRLTVSPETTDKHTGCKYCGQCMSGCVYKSIYKSSDDILRLSNSGAIDYKPGCLVLEITETGERVAVKYLDADGRENTQEFDRVFLAAGAVNSTRIVLNSLKLFDRKVKLKARGGYVMPVFSFKRLPIDWPNCNTQPGIFLEFKGGWFKHWVHVQISTANELLFQKLKIQPGASGLVAWFKKFLAEHVILMFVNFHSDYAGHYELWLTQPAGKSNTNCLHSRHYKSSSHSWIFTLSAFRLLKICLKIGCLPLIPFAKNNSGSYHVGGTLPMRHEAGDSLNTDDLGRVSAWRRVHIVDTSTFPSLPGTTIGLLTMANAMRIVEKIRW